MKCYLGGGHEDNASTGAPCILVDGSISKDNGIFIFVEHRNSMEGISFKLVRIGKLLCCSRKVDMKGGREEGPGRWRGFDGNVCSKMIVRNEGGQDVKSFTQPRGW